METIETNKGENPKTSENSRTILHNLDFLESLVYFADAELVLGEIGMDDAYYPQAEDERDSRIKAIADCVDAYCRRRIAQGIAQSLKQSLGQAEQRRGEEAAP